MKNKKLLLVSSVLLTLIIAITTILIVNKNNIDNEIVMQDNINQINNPFLTLMLEQDDGSYQESTTNTWPSGNYAFNSEMSRCENGGELRWDRENGIVELLSNKSDACYVYFDLYNVVTITNVSATKTTNSVTLTVTVDAGENPVATYYFSMDGGRSYQTSNTNTYTFSNLDYGTSYTFQVYAVDTQGYESNEETIEVTTDNYVNPTVNSVTATNVTTNSITVSVNASGGSNNIQTYYYSINNGSYASSSSNTHTFSGLSSGTNYSIRVYVKDTNGIDSKVYTISAETESIVYIANVCDRRDNLANCITNFYNSYGTDATQLYYHTSSLANSAGDNSYRYAGANPNNYVCFGSDATTCPSNNLYRIIGLFDGEVKLIKSTNYGNYYWSGSSGYISNSWDNSTLNTDILNNTYFLELDDKWQDLIVMSNWYVEGSSNTSTPRNWFNNEHNGTVYETYVGLMYVSDYGYAATPSYWNTSMGSYNNASNNNWLYLGDSEWTITRSSTSSSIAFAIYNGNVTVRNVYNSNFATRPTFYLTSSTQYVSGSGTSSDPIRIN